MNRVYNLRMKSAVAALWILCCAFSVNNLRAQTILDDLQSQTSDSDGIIRIDCAPSIIALMGKPNGQPNASSTTGFVERNGYRIQVFMGRDRSEVESKQSAILRAFPELAAHKQYDAPNWKLRVGDFITSEEATMFLHRLQKEFPQFGKEMFIVSEKIKLVIQR